MSTLSLYQGLLCCLDEDLPEHTQGGVASALPCTGNNLKREFCCDFLSAGCFGRHTDLLDAGGEQCLPPTGRGLRECVEGLLQETDRPAQLAHLPAPGQPQQRGSAKGILSSFSALIMRHYASSSTLYSCQSMGRSAGWSCWSCRNSCSKLSLQYSKPPVVQKKEANAAIQPFNFLHVGCVPTSLDILVTR